MNIKVPMKVFKKSDPQEDRSHDPIITVMGYKSFIWRYFSQQAINKFRLHSLCYNKGTTWKIYTNQQIELATRWIRYCNLSINLQNTMAFILYKKHFSTYI